MNYFLLKENPEINYIRILTECPNIQFITTFDSGGYQERFLIGSSDFWDKTYIMEIGACMPSEIPDFKIILSFREWQKFNYKKRIQKFRKFDNFFKCNTILITDKKCELPIREIHNDHIKVAKKVLKNVKKPRNEYFIKRNER